MSETKQFEARLLSGPKKIKFMVYKRFASCQRLSVLTELAFLKEQPTPVGKANFPLNIKK